MTTGNNEGPDFKKMFLLAEQEWYYGHLVHQAIRNVTIMDVRLAGLVLRKDE